jgi:hypothetical protein
VVTVDLDTHQRGLLALVAGPADAADPGVAPPGDPYLAEVAASGALPVARGIAASWRSYTLRRFCPLTWTALDQRGRLSAVLDRMARRPLSPYLRLQATVFTEEADADGGERDDRIVVAVARFERALVLPGAAGDQVVIDWPCDPDDVLSALIERRSTLDLPPARHRTRAPADDPTAVVIEAL